jgi:hypothetical protein
MDATSFPVSLSSTRTGARRWWIGHACSSRRQDGPVVVDKVTQFTAELEGPGTDAEERLYALKFVLHLVGER